MLSVRFWGVRGTSPSPGESTVLFGGNTACIELRADDRLVIIDLGTGARLLGDHFIANDVKNAPLDADIFITHTHWDHILGFPVFAPLYMSATTLRIWGPISAEDKTLEDIFRAQLNYTFWPVCLERFSAQIKYGQMQEGVFDFGRGLTVKSKFLNHPGLCLGYRFEYEGKSIVTAYDHEPFQNPSSSGTDHKEGRRNAEEKNEEMIAFFKGADILIHDAQYTAEEYHNGKYGWGHTCYEDALKFIQKADVKKAVFFHHDPQHTDEELARFEKKYQIKTGETSGLLARVNAFKKTPHIIMAREGMTLRA